MMRLLFLIILISGLATAQNSDNNKVIWDLQRCVEYALENNLSVKQTALGVDRANSTLDQSRQELLPNLNGNVNGNLSDGFVNDPTTNTISKQTVISSNVGLSSGYTVYAGGQIRNSILQNEINLKASDLDLEATQNDITLAVVQGYVNILLQQELVESADFQLASTKERRERTNKLVKAGAAAPAALLDIESQIATEELAVINARNQVQFAYMRLMQLLRLPLDNPFGVKRPELPEPEGIDGIMKPADIYKVAELNQPVIRAADLRIQSADYGIKLAEGGGRPTLSLNAGLNSVYASTGRRPGEQIGVVDGNPFAIKLAGEEVTITPINPIFSERAYPIWAQLWDRVNWGVGANLSIPIFNRGRVVNNIEQARINKLQSELNSEIQRQTLEQTIQQASFDVKSSFAQYEATIKQVEALEMAFENAEKQFNLGVINSVDYLVAKNNLNRSNNDLIRAKYDFIFKSKILDFYAGREIKL
ncbi:MAG: TolC family protein [Bacteroidia bacterium]